MKIETTGCESYGKVMLSIPKKLLKFFPKYFIIIIETQNISERKKGEKIYSGIR